jgi:membrane protease YdiL (CAAX protease family)
VLKRIFYDTYLRTEEESLQYRQGAKGSKADIKVMAICITVSLALSVIYYFGNSKFFGSFLESAGLSDWAAKFRYFVKDSEQAQLHRLAYWVSVIVVCYFILPFILIKFLFREKLSDYGLSPRGALKDYHVYALMLLVMVPLVLYFSGTESFQARYPFYDLAPGESLWPNFWIWQMLYFVQFFSLEFFFRGFMLHGLKKRFGFYSIFVMTIPYCMIHFGKPMPETIAAIIAGIVLGALSLKSRSIWLGIAIHYSVAITMDLAALWRKDLLF